MRRNKPVELDLAIMRGLQFIYRSACDLENFALYGHDYLFCFCCIAATSRNVELRRTALNIGYELARQWRRKHADVANDVDADDVANLVIGSYAADRLGARDHALKQKLREVAGCFASRDYLCFDPATEPPPTDVPDECECGACNPRGRKTCLRCKRGLTMLSRYGVWVDALTRSYIGERYGVRLGAAFVDVIKWLPFMRPYPKYQYGDDPDFYWVVYAITHVVYTLNDYSCYDLSPDWLPDEYSFLKRSLKQAIVMEDPETMGEFLDSLKAFGLSEDHPLIVKGMTYLLSEQNADGSWGDLEAEDTYERYHPTWTAIDGLREYALRTERLSFQGLRPLLAHNTKKRVRIRAAGH